MAQAKQSGRRSSSSCYFCCSSNSDGSSRRRRQQRQPGQWGVQRQAQALNTHIQQHLLAQGQLRPHCHPARPLTRPRPTTSSRCAHVWVNYPCHSLCK